MIFDGFGEMHMFNTGNFAVHVNSVMNIQTKNPRRTFSTSRVFLITAQIYSAIFLASQSCKYRCSSSS